VLERGVRPLFGAEGPPFFANLLLVLSDVTLTVGALTQLIQVTDSFWVKTKTTTLFTDIKNRRSKPPGDEQ
jgi:hypothetical protein